MLTGQETSAVRLYPNTLMRVTILFLRERSESARVSDGGEANLSDYLLQHSRVDFRPGSISSARCSPAAVLICGRCKNITNWQNRLNRLHACETRSEAIGCIELRLAMSLLMYVKLSGYFDKPLLCMSQNNITNSSWSEGSKPLRELLGYIRLGVTLISIIVIHRRMRRTTA